MDLTRNQIINSSLAYPKDFRTLKPTKHVKERLQERGMDLECIPSAVKITNNNIHSGRTMDGKTLCSVVVRIDYTKTKWLFICMNPFDCAWKTLWFRNKYGNRIQGQDDTTNHQQAI